MTDPQPVERITIANEQSLNTLVRAINYSQGEFSLILTRCNYTALREEIIQTLREQCPIEVRELDLPPSSRTLYTAIKSELGDNHPSALMVFGLEDIEELDAVLTSTNQVREEFRKEFSFPLIIWINDTILQKLIKLVPDLESWSTAVEFEMTAQDLLECVQKTTDEVFARVLSAGPGPFQGYRRFRLSAGTCRWEELEFVQKDLQNQGIALDPELAASFEFVLGRAISHSMEDSRQHYERSLALWQNSLNLVRQGCVAFNLGLWWRIYAAQHRNEFEQSCQKAAQYFRQTMEAFEQANHPDLVAKFINPLGEVLQRLEQWEELAEVAGRSLALNQTYSNLYQQADAHGLLATVAVSKADWVVARQEAETALHCLETAINAEAEPLSSDQQVFLNWERFFKKGWYLLALGKAQWHLGQKQDAIHTLEFAQTETKPDYDPSLYIQILRELRQFYFERKEYLKAFETRTLYRSIEQQYGFRAFVGAGRLQPFKTVVNPALISGDAQEELAQEISASGRQQDVNRLIERLGRSDQKLTVIHGQSGVGKSSILQAGLIPALNPITFDTREVVSILLQVYNNWSERLGQGLLEALKSFERLSLPGHLNSPSTILEQLRNSVNQNLMVVLIFDQFEEFFFVYKDPVERKSFYEFLKSCLNIPYVKVVLSLREDYLHYLLECNDRLVNLDIISNNILDKNILFYLGNFSREDARSVIKALTQSTPMPLEEVLINQLVNDLSEELGEVRPIELQITGAQLQSEGITTLQQYREKGPKDALVGRFLEEVTKDCGSENEQIAKLVLYLLTDENNTRPLKTRADLEMELNVAEKLDLILAILVRSGLVFKIPASPADRYQLVHDYLVLFIRQKQSAQLIGELEKEREQRKLTEAKLNQALTKQLRVARRATYSLAALVAAISGIAVIAGLIGINSYVSSQRVSSSQNRELDRVISALKVGKTLQRFPGVIPEVQVSALSELNQAISKNRMINRFSGHTDEITAIGFSADSQLIASASKDKTARIWRKDGNLVAPPFNHPAAVTAISINRDNSKVVTASEDGKVRIWSIQGDLLKTLNGHTAKVTAVVFSPDGSRIASGSKDKTIRFWSQAGKLIKTIRAHETEIDGIRFNKDGSLLVSFAKYDPVKAWNTRDFTQVGSLESYNTLQVESWNNDQVITVIRRDGSIRYYKPNGALITGGRIPIYSVRGILKSQTFKEQIAAVLRREDLKVIRLGKVSSWADTVELRHDEDVVTMGASPDSNLLVSATKDNRLVVWDVEQATENLDIDSEEQEKKILSVRLSPNEKTVVLGRANDTLTLLHRDGSLVKTIPGKAWNFSFSPDGQAIVTPSTENIIKVWTLGGKEVELRDPESSIVSYALSPDGEWIAAGNETGSMRIWKNDGTLLKVWKAHADKVRSIAFSSDGETIISSDQYTVKIWRQDGTLIATLPKFVHKVDQVILNPNGQTFLTLEEHGAPKLWRKDGTKLKDLLGHEESVLGAFFSSNGETIVTLGDPFQDYTLKLWTSNGRLVKTIGDAGDIYNGEFSPDGTKLFVPSFSGSVKVFNLDGTLQTTLQGHFGRVRDIDVSPGGTTTATASEDNTVRLWDEQGNSKGILRGHDSEVLGVSFSPDGRSVASIDRDNVVKLWNLNGANTRTLKAEALEANSSDLYADHKIEFSSDGEIITLVSTLYDRTQQSVQRAVTSWNKKGEKIHQISSQGENFSIFETKKYVKDIKASNHRVVPLMSQDPTLKLWSTQGKLITSLKGHTNWVNHISFSPNGQLIASASDDKTVKLWNRNGEIVANIKHKDMVNDVSFSRDGQTIATASKDKIVRFLSIKGKLLRELKEHTDQVYGVLFSPDRKTLVSSGKDNTIRFWRTSDGKQIDKVEIPTDEMQPSDLGQLAFSADGKILTLGADQVYVRLLNGTWLKQTAFRALDSFPEGGFPVEDKSIKVVGNSGVMVLTLGLDDLMKRGCNWVRDYLHTNSNINKGDRHLCDGIGHKK